MSLRARAQTRRHYPRYMLVMRLNSKCRGATPQATEPGLLRWLLVAFVYGLIVMLFDHFVSPEHYKTVAILLGSFLIYGAMKRRVPKARNQPS